MDARRVRGNESTMTARTETLHFEPDVIALPPDVTERIDRLITSEQRRTGLPTPKARRRIRAELLKAIAAWLTEKESKE